MRIDEAIRNAEDVAIAAVEHVGAANYAHREREALSRVRKAFADLRAAYRTAHKDDTDSELLTEDRHSWRDEL
jgi:hypothetical protein